VSSTFSALNTASLALYAQQRAIDVTGQNIANVNTDGYSRQRVDMQSIGGSTVPAIWSLSSQVGQGVNADQVTRIRDAFLEARAQTEHATTASLTVQSDALSSIEQTFQEPGTTGIQSMLTNVSTGWSDIHNNPTDPGARSQLLQRTQTLVAGLHTVPRWTVDEHPGQPGHTDDRRELIGQAGRGPEPGDRAGHRREDADQRAAGQARRPDPPSRRHGGRDVGQAE
jgi:hypothetical protein